MNVDCEIKIGLIGWFDILGYEEFLEKSDLTSAIEVVHEVQSKVRSASVERIQGCVSCAPAHNEKEIAAVREALDSTSWIIFSDTVVLALTVPQAEPIWMSRLRMATFLELAKYLHIYFFLAGLPLRGAISFGSFYLYENLSLFAGKPLLEAHGWAENQDWSGSVVAPSAEPIVYRLAEESREEARNLLLSYVIRYPVSCSPRRTETRTEKSMLCLNWPQGSPGFTGMDVPVLVNGQFSKYSKDISSARVQLKNNNTIRFLLDVQSHNGMATR